MTSLRFGVALTTDPGRTKGQLDALCRALSRATGLTVTAATHWHYHRLLESIGSGQVELAWLPPILAMRAAGRGRLMPIALPVRNGVASYCSALFCRDEAPYKSPADLRGVRAAWVDRQSAAGYLVVRAALRSQGVDLEQAFASDQFHGAHDAVARAVLDGEADVGATFVHLDPPEATDLRKARIARAGWGAAKVRLLTLAGPIPADLIAAHARVPMLVISKVLRALMDDEHPDVRQAARTLMSADGFIRPTGEHLAPLTNLLDGFEPDLANDAPVGRRLPTD